MSAGLDRDLVTWRAMRRGFELYSADNIETFLRIHPGWADADILLRRAEQAFLRTNPPARTIIQRFAGRELQWQSSKVMLARAYNEIGNSDRAAQILRPLWRTERLSQADQRRVMNDLLSVLTTADHRERAFRMLYQRHTDEAVALVRFLPEADGALVDAFASVSRGSGNAANKLAAVPRSAQRDPAYRFAQILLARQADDVRLAADLLIDAPKDPAALIEPDWWWVQRRIVGRSLREDGDMRDAYRVVSGHSAQGASEIVEAEFHSGWFALRFLNDAAAAERHFGNILTQATIQSTKARAHYWMGRSAKARGNRARSALHFRAATKFPTTYYGQLAMEELGDRRITLSRPRIARSDRAWFDSNASAVALKRLYALGRNTEAIAFLVHLSEIAPSSGVLALAHETAMSARDLRGALIVGRLAARKFDDADALAFPAGAFPTGTALPRDVEAALIYAVSRQESGFHTEARSSAGALGLMQLIPSTAQKVARDLSLSYSTSRLTSDPAYNAILGAAHLAELIEDYNGSYVLTFAGYNAGPAQTSRWLSRFGDPRTNRNIDMIDWVEMISFGETRSYIQKLLENLQVYRVVLDNQPLSLSADLNRGRR